MMEWANKTLKTASIAAGVLFILFILIGLIIANGGITIAFVIADIIFSLAIGVIIFLLTAISQAKKKK